jgi:hypothetical protein
MTTKFIPGLWAGEIHLDIVEEGLTGAVVDAHCSWCKQVHRVSVPYNVEKSFPCPNGSESMAYMFAVKVINKDVHTMQWLSEPQVQNIPRPAKPVIEETWVGTDDGWIEDVVEYGNCGSHAAEWKSEAHRAAALQAPAALRLLLKHQWGGLDECAYPICPECEQLDPQYIGNGIDPKDAHRTGHKPDCEIARVLREAKVIP